MTTPSTRAEARRRRSAKARNRGRRIAVGAAGYGELGSRGSDKRDPRAGVDVGVMLNPTREKYEQVARAPHID